MVYIPYYSLSPMNEKKQPVRAALAYLIIYLFPVANINNKYLHFLIVDLCYDAIISNSIFPITL